MELYWRHAGRASNPWKTFTHITIVSPAHRDKYIVGIQTEHLSVAIGIRTNALWLLKGQKVFRYQSRHPVFISRSPQPRYHALCPSLSASILFPMKLRQVGLLLCLEKMWYMLRMSEWIPSSLHAVMVWIWSLSQVHVLNACSLVGGTFLDA